MFELNNLYVSVCNPSISFFCYMRVVLHQFFLSSNNLIAICKILLESINIKFMYMLSDLVVASPVEDYFLYIDELPSPYKVRMHVPCTTLIMEIADLHVLIMIPNNS